MAQYLSKKAQSITPYVAGEQPKGKNIIKLNTNENPYPPSPKVIRATKAAIGAELRKYPDATGGSFRQAAAQYVGLQETNIFCGNGSDEVLGFAFQAFFEPGEPVASPDISYSFYPVWAKLYDITLKMIPLDKDFCLDPEDYYQSEGGVIIANPNAPTGIAISKDMVEAIVKNNPNKVVIIDEAYVEFGAESAVDLITTYENLLVVRTLSKSQSLAGMRAGFAVGSETLIDGLNRVKDSFNSYPIDRITEATAAAALIDKAYYQKANARVIETREWTTTALKAIGMTVLPSKTNFVFAKPNEQSARAVFEYLKTKSIYVRWFDKPRIKDFLRITIGNPKEMRALVDAIKTMK
ncbi:MAG: histidinol-phosphate transaminase [Eubacteriales bacterium]